MDSKRDPRFRLLGFGSPLVDLRSEVSEGFLERYIPGGKGGTVHVSGKELAELVALLPEAPKIAPGGSAGNTVFALNRLGIEAELLGKAGNDDYGRFYLERLERAGGTGRYLFRAAEAETGACLVLTTPDGERTMRSHLGSSLDLTEDEVGQTRFGEFDVLLVEGYMAASPVFDRVLEKARAEKCAIAFDPGSFELAHRRRERFREVIGDFVDILLVNRAEAESLCGKLPPEELARELGRRCPCVVLKLGAAGALIKRQGEEAVRVDACKVDKVADTTAAGDMFAAGFFFGVAAGAPPRLCGGLGARLAAEIVRRPGTELPEEIWRELRKDFTLIGKPEE